LPKNFQISWFQIDDLLASSDVTSYLNSKIDKSFTEYAKINSEFDPESP